MGEWIYRLNFLDLGTRWRRVVRFTPLPFHPGERAPVTHWIGDWVGPRAILDDMKRKVLIQLRLELGPLAHAARSQSLYRLIYPGSLGGICTSE
jgi:hypothetical protein